MNEIVVDSWSNFKTLASTKQLEMNYTEFSNRYEISVNEGILLWHITLIKDSGTDVGDFETNYKSIANRPTFSSGQFRNRYRNITGNSTVVVKSGRGVLRTITINNNTTGGNIVLYDNTAASGTKIATISIATPSGGLLSSSGQPSPTVTAYALEFATGLTVVTSGSSGNDITVCYV